jgi:hypothetical protein
MSQGCVLALTGRASDAIEMLISGIAAYRTTGATLYLPFSLLHLAGAHAALGQFETAWRCEKAAGLWGKAGERSQAHSALVEAAAQLTGALEHSERLPKQGTLFFGQSDKLLGLRGCHGPIAAQGIWHRRMGIGEAMTAAETTKETWGEAEIHRTGGEIALMSPEPDAAKARAHFERAIAIARAQKAKSWELRATMSMARLWRDHGKRQQARDLLAPVYGWFTEGFDTADLKEAKARRRCWTSCAEGDLTIIGSNRLGYDRIRPTQRTITTITTQPPGLGGGSVGEMWIFGNSMRLHVLLAISVLMLRNLVHSSSVSSQS